jgi:hypothetical protein
LGWLEGKKALSDESMAKELHQSDPLWVLACFISSAGGELRWATKVWHMIPGISILSTPVHGLRQR